MLETPPLPLPLRGGEGLRLPFSGGGCAFLSAVGAVTFFLAAGAVTSSRLYNLGYNAINACKNLIITKANDANALLFQISRSLLVIVIFVIMATPVNLDAQSELRAIKIQNERSDTLLPSEFQSVDATSLQSTPKSSLCRCQIVSQGYALLLLFAAVCFC